MNQSNVDDLRNIADLLRSHSDVLYYRVLRNCTHVGDIVVSMIDSPDRQAFKLDAFADQLQKETGDH